MRTHFLTEFYSKIALRLMISIFTAALVSSCSHKLVIETDPSEADVMIMGDDGRVLKTLGKTPLEIPIDDAISGDAGTITVQKKDYMRVSTLVSKGSLGATKQIYRIKLSPGMSGSSLASNLMKQIRLAQNYLSLKDFENAHKAVDQALEWDPTFTFGVSFKAGIFFVQKKYPQAKELYQRVLVQDPNETEASRMLRKIEEQTSGANP